VLADLVGRLVTALAAQARAYEAAASQAGGDLRESFDRLGRAKQTQAADLLPLARTLGVPGPIGPPASRPGPSPSWGVILGEAFQGERALERTGQELTVLAGDPAVKVLAARLAGGAARDGEEVRRLYLRYS
jgi:hypothetical protein